MLPDTKLILPFAKSVLFGAAAGAAPYLLLSLGFAILGLPRALTDIREFLAMLILAIIPLAVALPIVLCASIVIGLPTMALLVRHNRESAAAYVGIGAAAGALVGAAMSALIAAPDAAWAALLGGISGAVTGGTWWQTARKPSSA